MPLINMKWRKAAKLAQAMGQTLRSPSEFPEGTWGFRRNDIMIIHRSRIKIHCSSEQEARNIGYRYLPEEAQGTWRQSIFPFGGLRGDAKRLWLSKKEGEERRLQTRQVSNHKELLAVLRKSEPLVVIWAGGYEANSIPILDSLGNKVQIIKDSRGQYVTDEMSRLQYFKNNTGTAEHLSKSTKGKSKIETAVIEKCYAIGLGAGLPAGREEIGGEKLEGTRADGFNVYVGAHGKIILDDVCGVTSMIKNVGSDGTKNQEHGGLHNLNPQEGIVAKKHFASSHVVTNDVNRTTGSSSNSFENNCLQCSGNEQKKGLLPNGKRDSFDELLTPAVEVKSKGSSCSIQ